MRQSITVPGPVAHRRPVNLAAVAFMATLLLAGCAPQPAGTTQPARPIVAVAETPTTALETAATAEPTAPATTLHPTATATVEPSPTPIPTLEVGIGGPVTDALILNICQAVDLSCQEVTGITVDPTGLGFTAEVTAVTNRGRAIDHILYVSFSIEGDAEPRMLVKLDDPQSAGQQFEVLPEGEAFTFKPVTQETTSGTSSHITALNDFVIYAGPGEEYGRAFSTIDPREVVRMIDTTAGRVIDQKHVLSKHPDPNDRGDWLWVDFSSSRTSHMGSALSWVKGWEFDLSGIDIEKVPLRRSMPTPEAIIATTTGVINLRTGPGANYDIFGQLQPNQYVPVTGKSPDGSWLQITHNGRYYWVSASLVRASRLGEVAVVSVPPAPTSVSPASSATPEPVAVQETVSDRRYIIPAQPNSGFPESIDLTDASVSRTYHGQYGPVFTTTSWYDAPGGGSKKSFTWQWHISEVVGLSGNQVTVRFLADGRTLSFDIAGNSHLHILRPVNGNIQSPSVQFGNIDGSLIPSSIRAGDVIRVGDNIGVADINLSGSWINELLLVRNQ